MQFHGCLTGAWDMSKPWQLTPVWAGAVTLSGSQLAEVLLASGRAELIPSWLLSCCSPSSLACPSQPLSAQAGAAACEGSGTLWGSAPCAPLLKGRFRPCILPWRFGVWQALGPLLHGILAGVLRIPECCSLSSWADGVCLCLGNEL